MYIKNHISHCRTVCKDYRLEALARGSFCASPPCALNALKSAYCYYCLRVPYSLRGSASEYLFFTCFRVLIEHSRITEIIANRNGGGISVVQADLLMDDVVIEHNVAMNDGGGISCAEGTVEMVNSGVNHNALLGYYENGADGQNLVQAVEAAGFSFKATAH